MKECPRCGQDNVDSAVICRVCEYSLVEPKSDADVASAPTTLPPRVSYGSSSSGPNVQWDAANPERPTDRPSDGSHVFDDDLIEIEESGQFVIGVIGFATSGKTFFINRLKKFLRQEGGYDPKPAPPDDEAIVEGTTQIESHRFHVLETDAERLGRPSGRHFRRDREAFYLIDIPGERFREAIRADLSGPRAETLLKVLRLSHALIIVLPADDLLAPRLENEERLKLRRLEREIDGLAALGEGRSIEEGKKLARLEKEAGRLRARAENEQHLERLLDNIALISAVASELRDEHGNKITLDRYHEMNEAQQTAAYTGKLRGPAPFTYIALSKGDRLISHTQLRRVRTGFPHIKEPDLLDTDPGNVVRLHRPKIHQRIVQVFAWHKFDFVTCFSDQPADEKRIHYWLPHYGVDAVVEWIHWARDYSKKSGRREGGEHRYFNRIRGWWDRREGGFARRLGQWHEDGSRADPTRLGLDPAYYKSTRSRPLDGVRAWWSNMISRLMAPDNRALRLGGLGIAVLATAASIAWLMGIFSSTERRGYSFDLQPVYSAEIDQMERLAPVFGQGVVDRRLPRWLAIPSDGGWFSFNLRSNARPPLMDALRLIPADADAEPIDRQSAENAISNLQAAARADLRQVRAANSYHEALLRFMTNDMVAAASAFAVARIELDRATSEQPPGTQFEATTSRIGAVRASILHGQGTVELAREGGNIPLALDSLRTARSIARDPQSGVRDPTAVSQFWFPVTTRDATPMIRLETSSIWTNYLAALIRSHRMAITAGDDEAASVLRREMNDLVDRASEHADEASQYPRLAANLMIAAARCGKTNAIASFYVAGQPPEDVTSAVDRAQLIADPESSSDPNGRYWAITQHWRSLLSRSNRQPRAAVSAIARELEQNPSQARALRDWLADVMETEYGQSSGEARRQLTLNYGQYYDGPQWLRYANAYAPLGFPIGFIISLLLIGMFLALWFAFRRVRPTYAKLHVPQHRADRLAAADA